MIAPPSDGDQGVLNRALTTVLSLLAVVGILIAPLAVSTDTATATRAQAHPQQSAQEQSAQAPATSTTTLQDFDVEDVEDDGEDDHDFAGWAPLAIADIQCDRRPATPIPVDATRVPFRRRAFSSRAPPV